MPTTFTASPYNPNGLQQGRPVTVGEESSMPTSPAQVTALNCWLQELVIANPTGSAVTIQVYDSNNVYLIPPALSLAAGAILSYEGAHWMFGGFSWSASASGVSGYARFQPQ